MSESGYVLLAYIGGPRDGECEFVRHVPMEVYFPVLSNQLPRFVRDDEEVEMPDAMTVHLYQADGKTLRSSVVKYLYCGVRRV